MRQRGVTRMRLAPRLAVWGLLGLGVLAGCRTPPPPTEVLAIPPDARVATARALFDAGRWNEALILCVDLGRENPELPGLQRLQTEISQKMARQRLDEATERKPATVDKALADVERSGAVPDTFRMRRTVEGQSTPLRAATTRMQELLNRTVTLHLDGADLQTFILALGESEGVNIIADAELAAGGAMTVHATEVPLVEILDYVARNLKVSFHVGENVIWATPRADTDSDTPLDVRIYRLRKGDPGLTVTTGENAEPQNDQFAEAHVLLLEAINRFVPQSPGSDFLYNKNAHVLIVKNTRQNHAIIEDLVAALDVTPPQVLVEARFISVRVNNLRELGIDWLLNSSYTVSRKTILRNNVPVQAPKTVIQPGATLGFAPFINEGTGLNFTYQGLLTDPMFQAVLHALEESGKARALSVPRLTTVNNHEARIHVGELFLYFDRFRTISADVEVPGTPTQNSTIARREILVPDGLPREKQLGISLGVTPSIGADLRTITLALNPHIENFVRWEFFEIATGSGTTGSTVQQPNGSTTNLPSGTSVIKLPIFEQNDITTKVVVQSGETVVMGGIISTTEARIDRGVPFFSAIPLLGRLFTREESERVNENLLIFVTATILSERGEDLIPLADLAAEAAQ